MSDQDEIERMYGTVPMGEILLDMEEDYKILGVGEYE